MLSLFALPSAWSPQVDGRAVASRRTALSLGAALFAPLPAFATSKEKAKQMAIQKETAKEAKEAMKQYKFAPRPELEYGKKPDGTMGYVFVEVFNEKGASLKAERVADEAKGTGASSAKAKEIAIAKEAELKAAAKARKTRVLTQDEINIKAYADKNKDMARADTDRAGRQRIGRAQSLPTYCGSSMREASRRQCRKGWRRGGPSMGQHSIGEERPPVIPYPCTDRENQTCHFSQGGIMTAPRGTVYSYALGYF
eukprot:scaffold26272_cov51-Phaeocystis_antarctica.AAC.2